MAVWGTPVAREDDAERAVRAALDLVAAVPALGAEAGLEGLRLRAGVLTGQAAVDVGAEAEGMVIGDAVNTAARIQSVAPPGSVLVDDATHRATSAAIAYQEEGAFELKGKAEPVHTWRALRVVAGVGGKARAAALEAPFVGRDAELSALRSAFEEVIDGGPARLVSVIGEAGIGKSRLAWELQKHADGVSAALLWHRRALSALTARAWRSGRWPRWCGRAPASPRRRALPRRTAKLAAAVERYVPDPRERRLVEPRLAQLLGLAERGQADRAGLFLAWRTWVERLANALPTVMVFEDIQWADQGLLDFIEHLMEWSGELPLLIVTLARPELADRRPGSADASDATRLTLAPLPRAAMAELLGGLVPGLDAAVRDRLADRAEGVPLYAVEIVRMLLDRGVLERRGDAYAVIGDVDEVAVPETLHALVASRLDALSAPERHVLQDAAVVGLSFTLQALADVAGLGEEEARSLLDGLVRKQLLALDDDPLSAERGQYAFLQALVRRVAYETLGRADRRARHLATARHLEHAYGAGAAEIAEVARRPLPPGRPRRARRPRRRRARGPRLRHAGRGGRSRRGAGGARARRLATTSRQPSSRAMTSDVPEPSSWPVVRCGAARRPSGRSRRSPGPSSSSRPLESRAPPRGRARGSARSTSSRGASRTRSSSSNAPWPSSRRASPAPSSPSPAWAWEACGSWKATSSTGSRSVDAGLEIAERFLLLETLAEALSIKGVAQLYSRRRETGIALWKHVHRPRPSSTTSGWSSLWALNNLSATYEEQARFEEALEYTERGIELARRRGERSQELPLHGQQDRAAQRARALGRGARASGGAGGRHATWTGSPTGCRALLRLHAWRGDEDRRRTDLRGDRGATAHAGDRRGAARHRPGVHGAARRGAHGRPGGGAARRCPTTRSSRCTRRRWRGARGRVGARTTSTSSRR